MNDFLVMFLTVFMAEFGDKTQLATLLFASERKTSAWMVFASSGTALLVGAALATFLGTLASRYVQGVPFKLFAGIGFVLIGVWTLFQYYRGA
jgi:putative Ca2+/H+ antiporter (TMEM165/GDT1 family)